jgi:hypothetical protein
VIGWNELILLEFLAKGVVLLQFDGFGKGIELVRQKSNGCFLPWRRWQKAFGR